MADALRFTGIDHISLTVSNLNRSLDFYTGLFGNSVRKEAASERYYVRLGSGYLAMGDAAAGRRSGYLDHYCSGCQGVWLAPVRERLREIGVNFTEPDPFGIFWPDPFGIRHQLWMGDSWLDVARTAPVFSHPNGDAPLLQADRIQNVNIGVPDVSNAAPYYDKIFSGATTINTSTNLTVIYPIEKSTLTLRRAMEAAAIESAAILVREIPTGISAKINALGATVDSAEANRRINFRDPDGVRLSLVVA
jgi:catechol 2,3-dioxygenase-like lactoylglutathione lyase family enzyme